MDPKLEQILGVIQEIDTRVTALDTLVRALEPVPEPTPEPTPTPTLRLVSGPTVTQDTTGVLTVTWTLSEPATGASVYGLTPDLSDARPAATETGLYQTHVQRLGITFQPGTVYYFRVTSTAVSGTVTSPIIQFTTAALPPPPEPEPEPTPTPAPSKKWWGMPFVGTSLGNINVGVSNNLSFNNQRVYVPIRATSDEIRAIRWYVIKSTAGYAKGDGGDIRIRIVESANGLPTERYVGTGQILLNDMLSHPVFGRDVFSVPVPVERGELYFAQFTNVHPDPANNYCAVDVYSANWNSSSAFARSGTPFIPDVELKCYMQSGPGGTYRVHGARSMQCFEVEYTDGTFSGHPYVETWASAGNGSINQQEARKLSATQWHRQRMIPDRDMILTHLNVGARLISGSAPLLAEVRSPYTAILRTVSFPSSSFDPGYVLFPASSVALAAPLAVSAGVELYVTLRTTGSTVYNCFPSRCGDKGGYGFHKILNGWCEFSTNSGGSWSGGWVSKSGTITKQADLPVVFTVA